MPDLMNLMRNRHAVKHYTDKPLEGSVRASLEKEIAAVNEISGMHIQLVCDDPRAFTGFWASYQGFRNAKNYLLMAGPNSERLDEQAGYFGEHLVLIAQGLGLNTCWAGMGFNRRKAHYQLQEGDRAAIGIAIGYGENPGASSTHKAASEISNLTADSPDWFRNGIEAFVLAPTVFNEQETYIELLAETHPKSGKPLVRSSTTGKGPFSYVDYGIARYHFEAIAGLENFAWG